MQNKDNIVEEIVISMGREVKGKFSRLSSIKIIVNFIQLKEPN
jgi:hypothetical protein